MCLCVRVHWCMYVRIYVNASNHNMHVCRWVVGSIVVYEDDDDDAKYHSIMLTRRSDEMVPKELSNLWPEKIVLDLLIPGKSATFLHTQSVLCEMEEVGPTLKPIYLLLL